MNQGLEIINCTYNFLKNEKKLILIVNSFQLIATIVNSEQITHHQLWHLQYQLTTIQN